MRIVVKSHIGDKTYIDTQVGLISGTWIGDRPKENSIKDIEVEIQDTLEWGKDIKKIDFSSYQCGIKDDKVFFSGYIEAIEKDGFTVVRFADSIISINTIGTPFYMFDFIRFEVKTIEFHDTNI